MELIRVDELLERAKCTNTYIQIKSIVTGLPKIDAETHPKPVYKFKFSGYEGNSSIRNYPGTVYAENLEAAKNKYRAVFGINELADPLLVYFDEVFNQCDENREYKQ